VCVYISHVVKYQSRKPIGTTCRVINSAIDVKSGQTAEETWQEAVGKEAIAEMSVFACCVMPSLAAGKSRK